MDLLIIRHAHSTNNALSDQRWRVVDPPLTEPGSRQAALVAAYLATGRDLTSRPCETEPSNGERDPLHGVTRLYTSAMHRALLTCRPISMALGMRAEVWTDLHEQGGMWLDHGAPEGIAGYPGLARDEVLAVLPGAILPDELTDRGWYDPEQGCETLDQAKTRAERAAARLRGRASLDECIAIITHGGFSSLLLRALFATSPAASVFFHHDNTGMTRVRFRADGHISLRYLNRITHLPADLVT